MENNKKLIITHGDFDGIASAVLIARLEEMTAEDVRVIFTQPFLVDKIVIPEDIKRIYVLDIVINNRDVNMTKKFIESIYDRLILWADHHKGWTQGYVDDYKFAINEEELACAAIIGFVNDILVPDAIVADTRKGEMSSDGILIENAMKANMSDDSIRMSAVKWLLGDESQKSILEKSAEKYENIQKETDRLAKLYEVNGNVAIVDARNNHQYDLTQLLLAGQKISQFAIVKTINPSSKKEMITIATQSGKDLVKLFSLPSGSSFRVTLDMNKFTEALTKLNEEQI